MKKERKDKDFVKAAYFEGGRAGIEAFVKKELRYPKEALQAKVEGTVSVRYTVDYKGKVIEAGIIAGIGHGCDEEALRIVRSMQFKVPDDGKIKSKYSNKLHIHFRLPGSPAKLPTTKKVEGLSESMQVTYQVTSTPIKAKPVSPKPASYQIQINWPASGNEGNQEK
jgi:TonB family protein